MDSWIGKSAATDARVLKRSAESLIGLCSGMLADGILADTEIIFLDAWLADNTVLVDTWPGNVLYKRVQAALADGVITDTERDYLVKTMSDLVGGTMQETGVTSGLATSLPVDAVDEVIVPDHTFCFTGGFLFGTRKACIKATEPLGGHVLPRVTMNVDYLVIGTMASPDWINSSHGRKIETAVRYRDKGVPIAIVNESMWAASL